MTQQIDRNVENAFVTLVMKGEDYIVGALTLAKSLHDVESEPDVVCMITHEISDKGKKLLETEFDKVIRVDYISHKTPQLRSTKQQEIYGSWISESFTKWNCLKLTEYKKVMFLDSDVIVLKNIDHLFNLQAPAGTFDNPWAKPWIGSGIENPYPPFMIHGQKISNDIIKKGLKNKFVCIGTGILLEPSEISFDKMNQKLKQKSVYGNQKCISGYDEQLIVDTFSDLESNHRNEWTHIHRKYNMVTYRPSYSKNIDYSVLHYVGYNPWVVVRGEWEDMNQWWEIFDSILEIIKEPHKSYLSQMINEHQEKAKLDHEKRKLMNN